MVGAGHSAQPRVARPVKKSALGRRCGWLAATGAGDYYVVGYGENIDVPTIDIVSSEINFIGNLVGSYNDLCDLMALAARGSVNLHTQKYALDDFQSAISDLDNGNVRGRAILIP